MRFLNSTASKLQDTLKAAMIPSNSTTSFSHYSTASLQKSNVDIQRQKSRTAVMRLDQNISVPVTINRRDLHDEFIHWATSDVEFSSTARLVAIQSNPGQLKMMADDCDIVDSRRQSSFIYLQVNDHKITEVPMEAELYYTIHSGDVHIDTKAYATSDTRPKASDAYIIPYSADLRIEVVIRFPVKDVKLDKNPAKQLFGSLKRRMGRDMLEGMELTIASLTVNLCAADFGRERLSCKLKVEPYAIAITGRKADEVKADIMLTMGVWTGSTVARETNKRLTYEDFLTIQTNPRSPVWKRFWARTDLEEGCIRLYDFEYRDEKAQVLTINLSVNTDTASPDPELCYPIHTFQISKCPLTIGAFNPQASTASLPSQLPLEQLFTSQDTLIDQSLRPMASWICRADSAVQMQKWMSVLSSLVTALRKNQDRTRSKKRLI